MLELEKEIKSLAKQAEDSQESTDALRYSQAALNLANVMRTLDP